MPDWIVARLFADLGVDDAAGGARDRERTRRADAAGQPLAARPSTSVEAELLATGASVERGSAASPTRSSCAGGGDPGRMAAVADGRATPQDQGSQAVAAAVAVRAGRARPRGRVPRRAGRPPRWPRRWTTRARWSRVDSNAGPARPGAPRRGPARVCGGRSTGRGRPRRCRCTAGVVRPGPRRRAVLRLRGAAPPPGSPVADRARSGRRAGRAATGAARELRRRWSRPGGRLVYSVCTLTRAETLGRRRVGSHRAPGLRRRGRRRARRGGRGGEARCCSRRPRAPTGCTSWPCPVPRRSPLACARMGKIAPSILAADFSELAAEVESHPAAGRPPARRRDGRPLRAEPLDRRAGGEVPAAAHRPLPRLPPDDRQPG